MSTLAAFLGALALSWFCFTIGVNIIKIAMER